MTETDREIAERACQCTETFDGECIHYWHHHCCRARVEAGKAFAAGREAGERDGFAVFSLQYPEGTHSQVIERDYRAALDRIAQRRKGE